MKDKSNSDEKAAREHGQQHRIVWRNSRRGAKGVCGSTHRLNPVLKKLYENDNDLSKTCSWRFPSLSSSSSVDSTCNPSPLVDASIVATVVTWVLEFGIDDPLEKNLRHDDTTYCQLFVNCMLYLCPLLVHSLLYGCHTGNWLCCRILNIIMRYGANYLNSEHMKNKIMCAKNNPEIISYYKPPIFVF